nr:putative box C/D snoRNA protein SPCC613.07 [Coffea arabica]XP_027113644.1 putative box C/D snoRNA protein SPCC613.07 [Coffea arabica]
MEVQEESAAAPLTNPSPKQPLLCEECKHNPAKYKCPGCSIRSCSLPCVKAHKQRTSCTGKKQYKDVVPLSEFDDNLLLSDYNMLEGVKRVAESARRMRIKMCGYSHFRLPLPLKSLRSAAASRRTKLLFFSTGMSKREKNKTYYNYRRKYISWTIEWRFNSTNVVLLDHGIHENRTLYSVIENHLQLGPWKHQLKRFREESLDSLKFFIRKYPKGSRSPFRQLDINAPIREQLANLVILEYPVIHVFLPSQSYDFEVIKDVIPQKARVKESVSTDDVNQNGVTFKEEEIEEDGSWDTQVSDLASNNTLAKFKTHRQKMRRDKKPTKSFGRTCLAKANKGPMSYLTSNACNCNPEEVKNKEKSAICDNAVTGFEQGLVDAPAPSDLIAHTKRGDFLEIDGVVNGNGGLLGSCGHADSNPIEEGLEEGEIS